MARRPPRSDLPFADALTELLAEHGISANRLAKEAQVDQAFLSRVMRGVDYKTPSPKLLSAIADHFGLPEDYWREARERVVVERVKADVSLLNDVYRRVTRDD